jgi:hypothetical protein
MSTPGRLDLFGDVVAALESSLRLHESDQRLHRLIQEQVDQVLQDNAELRDELHALANRVEALTRAVGRDAA